MVEGSYSYRSLLVSGRIRQQREMSACVPLVCTLSPFNSAWYPNPRDSAALVQRLSSYSVYSLLTGRDLKLSFTDDCVFLHPVMVNNHLRQQASVSLGYLCGCMKTDQTAQYSSPKNKSFSIIIHLGWTLRPARSLGNGKLCECLVCKPKKRERGRFK